MRAVARDSGGNLLGLWAPRGDHDDHEVLEAVFAAGNDMPPPEWLVERLIGVTQHSLSVGDAVELIDTQGRRIYECMPSGWDLVGMRLTVSTAEVEELMKAEAGEHDEVG